MTTDVKPEAKKERTRSPNFPYIGLKDAVEKAKLIKDSDGKNPVVDTVVAKLWGYSPKSSGFMLSLSALKKFGLLEEVDGAAGRVKISSLGYEILVRQDGSPEKIDALKRAALNPKIHMELWKKYGNQQPSDENFKTTLLLDKGFNEDSVDGFIKEYKQTISYAGLSENDTILGQDGEKTGQDGEKMSSFGGVAMDRAGGGQGFKDFPIPTPDGISTFRIPFPMSEASFKLIKATLDMWKDTIVKKTEEES